MEQSATQFPRPLVLIGHGISFRVNHGALVVKKGFTHHRQKQEEWRFFRGDQTRPSRIVLVDGDGRITLDVLAWLSAQGIPLIQLDYRGRVVTAVGGTGHVADPRLMQAQLAAAADPKQRLGLASWLIREKLIRSIQVLCDLVPASPNRAAAIEQLTRDAELLERKPVITLDALLGVEGRSAAVYFRTWHEMPVRWKWVGRHPIPADWHRVGPRSSAKKLNSNRRATHPVQAMLNYAYAVLEGQIRIELVRAGFDVTVGFLHSMKPDRPALVLDVLEPARTVADRAILSFVIEQAFSPGDLTLTPQGVVRLHPQLAQRVVGAVDVAREIRPLLSDLSSTLSSRSK